MKFGELLRSSMIKDYECSYLDYDGLKKLLKKAKPKTSKPKSKTRPSRDAPSKWTDEDEENFCHVLTRELSMVAMKQEVQKSQLQRQMAVTRAETTEAMDKLQNRRAGEEGPSEHEFLLLEQDIGDLIVQVHELSKYVQLNYTGFCKIIKKHDKLTNWHLRPVFDSQLRARPFFQENYDAYVVELSDMNDKVRRRGIPRASGGSGSSSTGNFIRQTTKYWVHPDNITEVKLIVLKHLPVLVYNQDKQWDPDASAITSIYYDNPEKWPLYHGRLEKTEGAEAIRLRWYGNMKTDTVFVERKTHREDWTGESSVKARFSVKEKNVNDYLSGKMLPSAIFHKARVEGKKPRDMIDSDERLAREIQYSILRRKYRPVCRTFYNRTAFQLENDARVRISLDENLSMVREDGTTMTGPSPPPTNWRRMDIGIDYPFSQLPERDVCRFPYAVLEVKLQTDLGQQAPQWVKELIGSHLVEAVPKFSKFIHGTATLYPNDIDLLPFWMPQMHVDIRKPVTHDFGFRRKRSERSLGGSTSDDDDDDDEEDDSDDDDAPSQNSRVARPAGLVSFDDIERQSGDGVDVGDEQPLGDGQVVYESSDDEDGDAEPLQSRASPSTTMLGRVRRAAVSVARTIIPAQMGSTVPRNDRLATLFGRNDEIVHTHYRAPKGKKIHVPVRIEPKVYFANERTFLGWLEFSVYIGTIATTLLNFGQHHHPRSASISVAKHAHRAKMSLIAAGAFTLLAIACLVYATAVYIYRSRAIRSRRANARYYEAWGPRVLGGALVVAVGVNFWVRLGEL